MIKKVYKDPHFQFTRFTEALIHNPATNFNVQARSFFAFPLKMGL